MTLLQQSLCISDITNHELCDVALSYWDVLLLYCLFIYIACAAVIGLRKALWIGHMYFAVMIKKYHISESKLELESCCPTGIHNKKVR